MSPRSARGESTDARPARAAAVVYVGDLARMQAFYQRCFGLTVADSADGYRGLESPTLLLTLVRSAQAVPDAAPAPRRERTPVKLAFVVDGIATVRRLVVELGGEVDPAEKAWTFRGAVHTDVVDPEGNVVQLIELGTADRP